MSRSRAAFGWLQKIGKSLMLPVSVLPAAGILLGVGSAKFAWLPPVVSSVMAQAGGGVFGGILIGAVAAILFNRYFRLQLPPYLGFFSGKRSVPILTAFTAIFAGI